MLRTFAAAAPWPLWARGEDGNLNFANAAYARATEAAEAADAIQRNLELLDSDDRIAMDAGAGRPCRLCRAIADRDRRRAAHV